MVIIYLLLVVFSKGQMSLVENVLSELDNIKSVKIEQQIEVLEIITGCETANRYHVYGFNKKGEISYLFRCKEESDWCERNCCASSVRPFKMKIYHIRTRQQFNGVNDTSNYFALINKPISCSCFCLSRYISIIPDQL